MRILNLCILVTCCMLVLIIPAPIRSDEYVRIDLKNVKIIGNNNLIAVFVNSDSKAVLLEQKQRPRFNNSCDQRYSRHREITDSWNRMFAMKRLP